MEKFFTLWLLAMALACLYVGKHQEFTNAHHVRVTLGGHTLEDYDTTNRFQVVCVGATNIDGHTSVIWETNQLW